jgi:hypothetical protein
VPPGNPPGFPTMSEPETDPDGDDRVPLFGTWPAIYAAVVGCALVVMGLLALFSGWRY